MDRVGPTIELAALAVGPVDVDDAHTTSSELAFETGAIDTGALDPHHRHRTMRTDPGVQLTMAG